MFSRKIIYGFFFIFVFLSFVAFYTNMPESKNKRVYQEIMKYFPYKIKEEFVGLDIEDKRTGEDLDVENAKVFLVFDDLMKKWGKNHLKLSEDKNKLIVLDDKGDTLASIELKNENEKEFVKKFFFSFESKK